MTSETDTSPDEALRRDGPLSGLKIIEFTHYVMGPSIGVILADLGAEVIKIEPIEGDPTRRLLGSGAGYFPMYNRNKKSIRVDLRSTAGVKVATDLARWSDVVIENFRPGVMTRLGLDYEALSQANQGLIYCSAKGFLAGPYDQRAALDEVAQMMSGLAYMTGPPGRPLRAGASVVDVTGGMFGVIGILAALEQRHRTGRGQAVDCSLFETAAFLVGQHMAQKAVTGEAAKPMPVRTSAWAIYDVFDTADERQVFVGVVSDPQWISFCDVFDRPDWALDPSLATNNQRASSRERIIPDLRAQLAQLSKAELMRLAQKAKLPFAPVARPEDLETDPHLLASEGLVRVTAGERGPADLPALPLRMAGQRAGVRLDVPSAGEHSHEILAQVLGLSPESIQALEQQGAVA